jgi:hypothetical protein
MWRLRRGDVDSGLVSDLNGEMFGPRDQTVKTAVGAQIGFLHRRGAQESVAEKVRGAIVWAAGASRFVMSERRQCSIASGGLNNAGKM